MFFVERQRHAEPDSVFVPPTISPIVKGFISSEGFPDAAINREGMRDPDSLAIAVDVVVSAETF